MLAMPEALAIVALIAVAVAVVLPVVAAVRLHRHRERPVARSARLGWLAWREPPPAGRGGPRRLARPASVVCPGRAGHGGGSVLAGLNLGLSGLEIAPGVAVRGALSSPLAPTSQNRLIQANAPGALPRPGAWHQVPKEALMQVHRT
jgi:hypothetical protein